MSALVWIMMGIAVWHFTVFVPDRFWGGIVGAFVGAVAGSFIMAFAANGLTVPGRGDTELVQAAIALPGAVVGIAIIWAIGARRGNEIVEL